MQNTSQHLVLFDFDGTLAESIDEVYATFQSLAESISFHVPPFAEFKELSGKSHYIAMKRMNINVFEAFWILYRFGFHFSKKTHSITPIVGMRDILWQLHKQGHLLGIVTSNKKSFVQSFVEHHNFPPFVTIQSSLLPSFKHITIKRILGRTEIPPQRTLFIGDEVRDMRAGKRCAVTTIPVAWGLSLVADLETISQHSVAMTPNDLLVMIQDSLQTQ